MTPRGRLIRTANEAKIGRHTAMKFILWNIHSKVIDS